MTDDELFEIKVAANGMLPPEIYREIYECARQSHSTVVEVGTAHGAGTIAAAKGVGEGIKVYTIDKIAGGSRDSYGSVEENLRIIRGNFERFGVADRIEFLLGAPTEVADRIDASREIGMLILDADGAIDRDLALFCDRLAPGAPIVIDDYLDGGIYLWPKGWGRVHVDQKFKLTGLLVDHFEAKGLLERVRVIKRTYFGRKPEAGAPRFEADPEEIIALYRKFTFGEAKVPSRLIHSLDGWLTRNMPRARQRLKVMLGR